MKQQTKIIKSGVNEAINNDKYFKIDSEIYDSSEILKKTQIECTIPKDPNADVIKIRKKLIKKKKIKKNGKEKKKKKKEEKKRRKIEKKKRKKEEKNNKIIKNI